MSISPSRNLRQALERPEEHCGGCFGTGRRGHGKFCNPVLLVQVERQEGTTVALQRHQAAQLWQGLPSVVQPQRWPILVLGQQMLLRQEGDAGQSDRKSVV